MKQIRKDAKKKHQNYRNTRKKIKKVCHKKEIKIKQSLLRTEAYILFL